MLVDVHVHDEGGWTIVSVIGELDLAVAPRLRHAVVAAIGPRPDLTPAPAIVLDLAAVHFLDSTGLGVVLGALRRVRQAGGRLRVVVEQPKVVELLDLLDLGRVLDLWPSVAAATAEPPQPASTVPDLGAGDVGRG